MLQGAPWPVQAVQDTVRAIAEQAPYRRSIRTSLLGRLWRWLGEWLDRLFDAVAAIPHARALGVALAVALALLVVARIVWSARLGDTPATRRRGTHAGEEPGVAEADRLAAAGELERAVHALHAAVVAVLARRALVRRHRSKTNGDYARELRARGAVVLGSFRTFARQHDALLYGRATLDAERWRALREAAASVLDAAASEGAARAVASATRGRRAERLA